MAKLKKLPIYDLANICIGFECPEKEIKIIECEKFVADEIIIPHHYSHKVTTNSCINLVVMYKGKREGALQIGYGIRPKIKSGGA